MIDIDLVLLGNERAMEPAYEWPDEPCIPAGAHVRAHGADNYLILDVTKFEEYRNTLDNPINSDWSRPGDPLYLFNTTARDSMAQLIQVEHINEMAIADSTDSDNIYCHVCHDEAAVDDSTRCSAHPMSTYNSDGYRHDQPNVSWRKSAPSRIE